MQCNIDAPFLEPEPGHHFITVYLRYIDHRLSLSPGHHNIDFFLAAQYCFKDHHRLSLAIVAAVSLCPQPLSFNEGKKFRLVALCNPVPRA